MRTYAARWWSNPPPVLRYAAAIGAVALAVALARVLDFYWKSTPVVSLFLLAIMFAAWFGGFRPGMLAALLSILAFHYYFVAPTHSFFVQLSELPRAILFAVAAVLVGSLSAGQRNALEKLRDSEQRFRDYAETASDWLWETGPDHATTWVSEKVSDLGIDRASRIGLFRWDIATDVEEEPDKWRLHRGALEAHEPFRHFRFRIARGDGSAVYVASSGKPVFGSDGHFLGYRGVSSDITAAVRAEQTEKALHEAKGELAHVTRVSTLGEVTASFAHEVNQPLASIVNNANACLGLLESGASDLDEVRDALGDIVGDAERASAIIQRVRALAQRSSPERVPVKLHEIVADVVALAASESTARRVTIRADVRADLPVVSGDRVQLQQVLLNLVVNGMDAMTGVQEPERLLEIRGQAGAHEGVPVAVVSVEDRGVGLDAAQMGRLFEAFYTTKPHGMGLGLAISRSIIEAHGGRLWAEPKPGRGATFSFRLPAALVTE